MESDKNNWRATNQDLLLAYANLMLLTLSTRDVHESRELLERYVDLRRQYFGVNYRFSVCGNSVHWSKHLNGIIFSVIYPEVIVNIMNYLEGIFFCGDIIIGFV